MEVDDDHQACQKIQESQLVWFLTHACQCEGVYCRSDECKYVKKLIEHCTGTCTVRDKSECAFCVSLVKLVRVHSLDCPATDSCSVPFCDSVKQVLRQDQICGGATSMEFQVNEVFRQLRIREELAIRESTSYSIRVAQRTELPSGWQSMLANQSSTSDQQQLPQQRTPSSDLRLTRQTAQPQSDKRSPTSCLVVAKYRPRFKFLNADEANSQATGQPLDVINVTDFVTPRSEPAGSGNASQDVTGETVLVSQQIMTKFAKQQANLKRWGSMDPHHKTVRCKPPTRQSTSPTSPKKSPRHNLANSSPKKSPRHNVANSSPTKSPSHNVANSSPTKSPSHNAVNIFNSSSTSSSRCNVTNLPPTSISLRGSAVRCINLQHMNVQHPAQPGQTSVKNSSKGKALINKLYNPSEITDFNVAMYMKYRGVFTQLLHGTAAQLSPGLQRLSDQVDALSMSDSARVQQAMEEFEKLSLGEEQEQEIEDKLLARFKSEDEANKKEPEK